MAKAPAGALRSSAQDLPITQARFNANPPSTTIGGQAPKEPSPQIVHPTTGAKIDLEGLRASNAPLVLRLNGGRPPFRWITNGKVLSARERSRNFQWLPDAVGPATLTVIDAAGRAASVQVDIE